MKDNKYQIKLFNKIAKIGTDRLDPAVTAFGEDVENADAILVRSAKLNDMEFNPELLCIARAGIGVNNIPIDRCSEAGIVVFNTPGANANAVKELAVCALLLASRKISDGIAWAKTLAGTEGVAAAVEKGKAAFVGPELNGKSLGVIGLGHIGAIISNIAYNLGMDVCGVDPYLTVENALVLNRHVRRVASNKDVYANSDYITLHVPLNAETKHMINAETIAQMKDGVRIINLSRGELVDDEAMAAALESGKVAAYVTDFPNEKTLEMKNAVCMPHLGASTPESEDNCAVMAADEAQNYLLNGTVMNSVNFPSIDMPFETKSRVVVIHKNIPNMVSTVSSSFAENGVNIEHMTNRSKKDYAITLVDVDSDVSEDVVAKITEREGIIKVRVITR
ncbi:MAG: 3-phosphoglycerate dehydrogenase [Ruminococcaceae bacterium]|nr:3-phosphoglycerate dehydrogenase [Oscillospiraceae bacterium]